MENTVETAAAAKTSFTFVKTFEETNSYPFLNSFNLFMLLDVIYLLAVLKILPDMMKNRKPLKLRIPIVFYNAVQVCLSGYFVYLSSQIIFEKGLIPITVAEDDPDTRKKMIYCSYVYLGGKLTEFLDTIFFCLRKKYNNVTFLHVYHHAASMIGAFLMTKYSISITWIYLCGINSLVHVVMYFYYGVSALGPEYAKYLTWKKYITAFQLIQFVTILVHQIVSIIVTRGQHSILGIAYICYSTVLFFYLFTKFYDENYTKSKKSEEAVPKDTKIQ